MPAFGRDGGVWSESDMRMRSDGAWTDERDNVYGRLDGAWVLIQPEAQDLLAPENLAAVPTDSAVTITWTDPVQDTTPTHVQFRIPEITPIWTEFIYGTNAATLNALDPLTNYQAQVRYILRSEVDGQIEIEGATATVFFTTLAQDGPGVPAPDPGGTGNDSIINWGNTNNPGPVGSAFCWWEYVIQEFDYATGFTDTLVTAEVDGDIGSLAFNFVTEGFACGDVLRWKYREVCNSVPGTWQYASAFSVICDYTDACGGAAQTTDFTDVSLYSDPDIVFAMPKMCWNNTIFENEIIDFVVADVEYGKLSGYALPLYLDNAWELVAGSGLSEYGEPVAAGRVPGLVPIGSAVPGLQSDFTFNLGVYLDIVPQAGSGAPLKIFEVGKTCKVYAYADGSSWTVTVSIPKEGGGTFDLTSTQPLTVDAWHMITVTIDQDGNKILYIDGVADTTDVDTTRADFSDFTSEVELYMNDNGKLRKVASWGRVLTPGEVGTLYQPFAVSPTVAYFNYVQTGAVTNHSIAHASPQAGDLIVVCVRTRDGTSSDAALNTPPTGFTLVSRSRGSAMYQKVADGTESGNVTVAATPATSAALSGISMAYIRGCDTGREFGGFWPSTAWGVEQISTSPNAITLNVHSPFTRQPAEGTTVYCMVIHEVAEDVADDPTPGTSDVPNAATSITNIQRAGSTGTLVEIVDAETYLSNTVFNLPLEWTTASDVMYGWFWTQSPQTAEWNSKPQIVEQTTRDTQGSSDKDILLSADIEDGELVVAWTSMPWGDITGLDGMTEEFEILRTGSSYEHILSKIYATADGDRYTLTTSAGYASLSIRHMVFRIRNASGAVQANGVWQSNGTPGTTVPHTNVAITPAVGDLLIALARATGAETLVLNTANGWPDEGRNYIFTGGPTPDEGTVWVSKYDTGGVSLNMPIYADDTGDTLFDRTGMVIAITP